MVKLVGRVIPSPPESPLIIGGWRSFDVHSAHYHSEKRRRIPFTSRWYLPDGPRWAKTQPPRNTSTPCWRTPRPASRNISRRTIRAIGYPSASIGLLLGASIRTQEWKFGRRG